MSNLQISEISAVFGEVLRLYRVERDISQEELAFLAGVDRTFVSRLERGIRQPTITTLIGIGLALGVSAADMVKEAEKEYLKHAKLDHLTKQTAMVKEKKKKYAKTPKR
ncbi:MAG TPA: helix-turn-helix transcriptional regulator [Candidatus Acidoferrum sp.]|nr:helix-turn-helix transcriptional regulator [Candidatus Acidoferrum sp.]